MSAEVCTCEACTLANVQHPPLTLPATRTAPARELHGVELRDHIEARDKCREAFREAAKPKQP